MGAFVIQLGSVVCQGLQSLGSPKRKRGTLSPSLALRAAKGFLMGLLLLFVPALAPAAVRMPGDKPLPREPRPDPDLKPEDGKVPPQLFYVAYEGLRPRELPQAGAAEVEPARPIRFMEAYPWAADYQDGAEGYILLVKTNQAGDKVLDWIGWVNKKYLVMQRRAQFNRYNRIYRKAMIINSVESQIKEKRFVDTIPVRLAPLDSGRPRATYRLFSLFYVFGQADGFVLLGSSPEFDPDSDPDAPFKTVLGWMPKERVSIWNTREAIEWDTPSTSAATELRSIPQGRLYVSTDLRSLTPRPRRSRPGRIFEEPRFAYAALKNSDSREGSIFSEAFTFQGESIPLRDLREMRFPVFDWNGTPEYPRLTESANELLKVGVKGSFVTEEGKQISPSEIDRIQEGIRSINSQLGSAEIIFVIDDTQSMRDWFTAVADVYDEIVGLVLKESGRQVKIGVTYYNDNEDGKNPNPVVVNRLSDARKQGAQEARKVREHLYVSGGLPREMVFDGLKKAVRESGLSPTVARKIVILIGDMGDHSNENDPAHARQVAQAFLEKAKEAPVEFFPIQVIDPDNTPNKIDSRAFKKQMQTILKELKQSEDHYYSLKLNEGDKVTEEHRRRLREIIRKRYDEMTLQVRRWRETLDEYERGNWDNTRIDPELEKILKDNGVELDQLRRARGFQVFREGYVWRRTPHQEETYQIRDRLLVNDKDINVLLKILEAVTSKDPNRPKVKDLVARLVETQVGDNRISAEDAQDLRGKLKSGEITVDEIIDKATGMKVRNPFLTRKLKDLNDDRFTEKELHELRYKKMILEGVLAGKENRFEEYTRTEGGFEKRYWHQIVPGKEVDREFRMGGLDVAGKLEEAKRVRWYWIDLIEEWP